MTLRYLLSAFICVFTIMSKSQNFAEIKNSLLTETKVKRPSFIDLAGMVNNSVYGMVQAPGFAGSEYVAEGFDVQNSAIVFSGKPEGKYENSDIYYRRFVILNGKLYHVGTARNKKEKKFFALAQTIDEKGTMGKQEILDVTEHSKDLSTAESFFKSSAEGKCLINVVYNWRSGLEHEFLKAVVFDENLKKISEADFGAVFPDRSQKYISSECDEKGNIVLLLKYDKKKNEKKYFQDAEGYRVVRYNAADKKITDGVIEIGERKITQVNVKINKSGQVVVTGFTSNYQADNIGGIFNQVWDFSSVNPVSSKETFLPLSLTTKVSKSKKGDKGTELDNFRIGNSTILDNGNVAISVQYNNTNFINEYRVEYFLGDVIIFCINPTSGELVWTSHLPLQFSKFNDKYGAGHFICSNNNDVFVVFNDNKVAGKSSAGSDNVSYIGKIGADGVLTRQEILANTNGNVMVEPSSWLKRNNTCIVRTINADGDRTGFSVITFK